MPPLLWVSLITLAPNDLFSTLRYWFAPHLHSVSVFVMSDCRCTWSESLTVKSETQGQFPYCHVVTAAGWATLGCCLILHIWHSLSCLFAMREFRLMIIIFEEGIKHYGTPPYCKNYWPRKTIPPRAYYNRAILNAANFTSCFRTCTVVVCGFIVCLQVVE